jgi:hypothetical protein
MRPANQPTVMNVAHCRDMLRRTISILAFKSLQVKGQRTVNRKEQEGKAESRQTLAV